MMYIVSIQKRFISSLPSLVSFRYEIQLIITVAEYELHHTVSISVRAARATELSFGTLSVVLELSKLFSFFSLIDCSACETIPSTEIYLESEYEGEEY
jgi:hypothetical protein